MIDGLIMDYNLGSKPSQLDYINKRNHESSSMIFFFFSQNLAFMCTQDFDNWSSAMLFCPSTKNMGEGKMLSNVYGAQCSVQLMLFVIKKEKVCVMS